MVILNCTGFALANRKILITTDAQSTPLQLEFMRPLTAAMLSERRAVQPFGLMGGSNAAKGMNLIIRKDGHTMNMGAKNVAKFQVRDIFYENDIENVHVWYVIFISLIGNCVQFLKPLCAVIEDLCTFIDPIGLLDWQGGDRLRILTPGGGGYYTPDAGVEEGGELAKPSNQVEVYSTNIITLHYTHQFPWPR